MFNQHELPDPEEIQHVTREILSDEVYRAEPTVSALKTFLEWLRDFLEGFEALRLNSPLLYWLLVGAMVLVLILILLHSFHTLMTAIRNAPPSDAADLDPVTGLTCPQLVARAEALLQEGNLIQAIRHFYRASLMALHERRLIRIGESETPGEIRQRLSGRVPLRKRFDSLLAVYEPCVFGWTAPTKEDVETCRETVSFFLKP